MIKSRVRLGDLLVEKGIITEEELQKALATQKELREKGEYKKLGEIIISLGFATEKQILETLSMQLKIPFVDLYAEDIDYNLMLSFPFNLLYDNLIVPFKEVSNYLYIATPDPLEYAPLETISKFYNKEIKLFIALKRDVLVILERLRIKIETQTLVEQVKSEISIGGNENISAIDELIDLILKTAIKHRATDIHIEPSKYQVSIRARTDGVLKELFAFEKEIYYPLTSKIKIISNIDISEKRKPQDGRFSKDYDNNFYDFRVSTIPTLHGESVVIRILDQNKILFKMHELGMSEYNLEKFAHLIKTPYGVIFVTGPTGSGKTTTLYSALNEVKGVDKKIITIEDPVEYEISLVQQIPVNYKVGVTFASILKNILRQDPDIIMIGEVRDSETLNAALQAALTGHLVFATLHTNDAISTITRLVQMGAENYLVSDALSGVVAQRLIRKNCPYCIEEYIPSKEDLKLVSKYLDKDVKFYKGKGCKHCDFTGFLGREIISEVLIVDEELSHLIAVGADKSVILEKAIQHKFVPMIIDGLNKVKEKITSLEEILRVVKIDEI